MTAIDRTEQVVRAWLADSVEPPRVPEYLPDLIALTARTSQRPAWTLPERWIPVTALTPGVVGLRPVPWRAIALLVVLLALVGATVAVNSSRPRPLPPPFGRAANGLVAYAYGGDISAVDPVSGESRLLTTGRDLDADPVFSRDGTRIAFTRTVGGIVTLFVAAADGSNATRLDVRPVEEVTFSPDGTSILAVSRDARGRIALVVAPIDGAAPRVVVAGELDAIEGAAWRPPDGREIFFVGDPRGRRTAIFRADRDGGDPRAIVQMEQPWNVGMPPVFSPDGTRVAIMAWLDAAGLTVRPRILTLADETIAEPRLPPGVVWQVVFDWSNDGQSWIVARGYDGAFGRVVLAIVPVADPGSIGVETPAAVPLMRECCISAEWAPDDSVILVTPIDQLGARAAQVLVDPTTGQVRPAPWTTNSPAAWQRLAP